LHWKSFFFVFVFRSCRFVRVRVLVRVSYEHSSYVRTNVYVFLTFVDFLFFVLHNSTTVLCCAFSFIHTEYEVSTVVVVLPHILTKKAQITPTTAGSKRRAVSRVAVLSLSNIQLCCPGAWWSQLMFIPSMFRMHAKSAVSSLCTMNLLAFSSRCLLALHHGPFASVAGGVSRPRSGALVCTTCIQQLTPSELENLSHTNSKYFVPKYLGPVLKGLSRK